MVRLSAGRLEMNEEAQLLCLLAGANSIFVGERLLTTANPPYEQDLALLAAAGVEPMRSPPPPPAQNFRANAKPGP
jgi:biotin synthase